MPTTFMSSSRTASTPSQPRVDLAAAAALADDLRQLLVAGLADLQPGAVVEEDVEFVNVVRHPRARAVELRHDRADSAGVVADHAAERAVVVRGGVGAEGELVLGLGGFAQVVEDQTRLDAREPPLGVDLDDLVQVLGEVDDHGDVAALAGETCAAAMG